MSTKDSSARPVWWIASLIFHALLLGWLIFLSPVRIIDLSKKSQSKVSPARAAKVMDEVRKKEADALEENVRALEETRRELAELEKAKRAELRAASPVVAEDAIEKIASAQQEAAKAQAAASEAMAKAEEELKSALNRGEKTQPPGFTSASEETRAAQENSGKRQAEALETLVKADPKFEPAYQAQADANTAQDRAREAQEAAVGQLSGAEDLRKKNASVIDDLKEVQADAIESESLLAEARKKSEELTKSLPQLRSQAEAAKLAADAALAESNSAQASVDKERAKAARNAANTAKKSASNAQKAVYNAEKNLTRAKSDIAKFETRLADKKARVEKFSSKSQPATANADAFEKGAVQKQAEARRFQDEAKEKQAKAATAFESARSGGGGSASSSPTPQASPKPEGLAGVYNDAVRAEAQLAEMYRQLRATELSMRRNIPLSDAMKLTDVAQPIRPDLAPALQNSNTNSTDVESQRQAVMEARSEVATMRALADSMLQQAKALATSDISQQQNLDQLAVEDDNQRAKDLTAAMQGGAGSSAAGSLGSGNPGSGNPGSGGAGSGGAGSGGAGSGGAGSGGAGSGGAGGLGSGGSGPGDGLGGGSPPPDVPKDLNALPGRVIGAGAVPGRWMFVDSWYLLGPFDNARRANIDKQFPPETIVDLNAAYVGKRGRPVRWEFHQSPGARVAPPFENYSPLATGQSDGGAGAFKSRDLEYIIYYGYTELRTEKECDVWIAVGSDDFSKVWINDQLVWASGQQLKSWRVDEGFRKVRLKQGVNRVLVRVENGHSQSEFSLAVSGS